MIGVYHDSFIDLLKTHLGEPIKITNKNIICRCPWCEINKSGSSDHFHLWISKDAPIFNCFHCGETSQAKGPITKLIAKITGEEVIDKYVDKSKIVEMQSATISVNKQVIEKKKLTFPEIDEDVFPKKTEYLKNRLKYSSISLSTLPGLVFDVSMFLHINNLTMDAVLSQHLQTFQGNFVGFVTENHTTLILRNIDPNSKFRYYKFKFSESRFLDYYKLKGIKPESTHIVLGEGIFDIYSDYIFDFTGLKNKVAFYASANSNKYMSVLNSVLYHEQIFRPNVHIISDRGIDLEFYKRVAHFSRYCLESMIVYYNKLGKDFNDTPCEIEKIPIDIT